LKSAVHRVASVDALRGLAMLILVSNIHGGFSFYEMAERFPNSTMWAALARQFTHVEWSGLAFWDVVMPCFVLLVGVSMPFSYAARRARGDSEAQIAGHAALRIVTLFLLGIIVMISIRSLADFLWPLMLLALGLPVPEWVARMAKVSSASAKLAIATLWWGGILGATVVWIALNIPRLAAYDIAGLLPQVALAYLVAFPFVRFSARVQGIAAVAILAIWWLMFALYPLPGADRNLAALGVSPTHEWFTGFWAHWNMNTNIAADFDVWFLNLLPRAQPFAYHAHGYQTLAFIPTAAVILIGMVAGKTLQSGQPGERIRNLLGLGGLACMAVGWIASLTISPLVKSIWTVPYVIFTSGIVLVVLSLLYQAFELANRARWALPFVVVGTNSILLYVLASNYRWWFLNRWQDVLGSGAFSGPRAPLFESLLMVFSLWALAAVLYRLRIFIRI
jgi:heparan-alpha-glucosaminide N-acetyltransferase